MTIKELVQELWRLEGKKSKVTIANMREIVAIICDKIAAPGGIDLMVVLQQHGFRRAARAKKFKTKK